MKRSELREKAMINIYQNLLLKKNIIEIIENNSEKSVKEVDRFIVDICVTAIKNKKEYISIVNQYLNDWTFDRLAFLEQAVLLVACAELQLNTAQKPIIIDEAINLCKKYCDEQSYKYINGVLDRL